MYDQYFFQIRMPSGANWVRGDILLCIGSIVTREGISVGLLIAGVCISFIHRAELGFGGKRGGCPSNRAYNIYIFIQSDNTHHLQLYGQSLFSIYISEIKKVLFLKYYLWLFSLICVVSPIWGNGRSLRIH